MQRINCAIYVRKSNEKGLDLEFNSLQNQEEACKNYILSQAFNGWEYCKTYTDGGISGGTMKRPALEEMISDIKKGLIQIVVSYKVDRLSRSIIDFHNMMKEFEKYNCNFVSITQAFDTSTSMGKLTLNMLLSFAQFEREVSGERIRDKIAATKAKGLWIGGHPPLGYDVVDKKLIPNKKEAEQVNTIFEKYLQLGSISALHEYISISNIRSKKRVTKNGRTIGGGRILPCTLADMLRSSIYIGRIEYKKENTSYPGQHKPIVDKKLFDQVQNLLDSNQNKFNETHEMDGNLLSRKIFDQNGNMFKNQKSSKNKNKKYKYYTLKKLYLPAGDIDEITIQTIKKLFDYPLAAVLSKPQALEFKSIDFKSLTLPEQSDLIRAMINKIIYHDRSMLYFIKTDDLSYLNRFKKENYLNTTNSRIKDKNKDTKIYLSENNQNLIIEKEICFSRSHLTNRFVGEGKKIISISERNNILIKAMSIAWRYAKMAQQGILPKTIAVNEKKTSRTIYRYLNLNYLSPNIVNDIMNSRIPPNINLQALFDIASKYEGFEEQEEAFYRSVM